MKEIFFGLKIAIFFIRFVNGDKPCEYSFEMKAQNLNKRLIGYTINEFSVSSHHDCARECMSLMVCKSLDFHVKDKICKLNDADSQSVKETDFEVKGGAVFSDITEWPSFHMMSEIPRISTEFFTHNPTVPFVHNFGKLSPGKRFQIEGLFLPNPTRFAIDILQGGKASTEVAMLFCVRFQGGADQNVIVRNHRQGSWGTEERNIPFFPFKTSVPFRISILFEKKVFKVAVDNDHFIEFRHRHLTMDHIDTLYIKGSVQLTKVMIQG